MPIEDRNLSPGTVLVAKYKQQEYRCTVVQGEEGKRRYRLEDGREFTSPSSAGSAVMDGKACNGWRFWSVETGEPQPEPEPASESMEVTASTETAEETEETPAEPVERAEETEEDGEPGVEVVPAPPKQPAEELAPARKRLFRVPNQKGVPEGETRYYCHDCGQSFTAPSGAPPQACPAGHPAQ